MNHKDFFEIEDMDKVGRGSLPGGEDYYEPYAKRRKRRRRRGIFLPVFLCLIALASLTGCLFLLVENRALEMEAAQAASYMDEMSAAASYSEEEVQGIAEQAAAEASKQKEEEILGTVKEMMENGEGTYFLLRELYPEELVVAADSRYYFFPILDSLKHHSYQKDQFLMNDDDILEYVVDVEEVTTKNPRTKELTKEDRTEACIAFCERVKEAGYTPMIYGNLKTFLLMLDMEKLEEYEKWFAYYRTPLYFPYEFSVWQYTSTGKVDGISTDVDLNVSMKDWGNGE